MGNTMQHSNMLPTHSPQHCSAVLPLDIWSIIFHEAAVGGELHLTQHVVRQPFNLNARFVNAQRSFLSVCTTSREAIFKHLVLFINVTDITGVRLALPSTVLQSIQHVTRILDILPDFKPQAHRQLDMDWFPALRNLNVLVKTQLKRQYNPPMVRPLNEEEMRIDADYIAVISLAGGHFTRRCKQSADSVGYTWVRYWRCPPLEESIPSIEENLKEPPIYVVEKVNIIIDYELTYVIQRNYGLPYYTSSWLPYWLPYWPSFAAQLGCENPSDGSQAD